MALTNYQALLPTALQKLQQKNTEKIFKVMLKILRRLKSLIIQAARGQKDNQ